MKIRNDDAQEREFPTLGVILQAGESIDTDAKSTPAPKITTTTTPSAASDSTASEVK
jgi:hypothetical protein